MNQFEEVLKAYSPMITAVLKRAKIYKNHQYYRHIATIALWEAWTKYDSARGDFAPYAYRYMLTSIYSEMKRENKQNERFICYEKETIDVINQYKNNHDHVYINDELLEKIYTLLSEEEVTLLLDLYVHGYSYNEVSKKTGVSIAALKKRRVRLMKKIRETFS